MTYFLIGFIAGLLTTMLAAVAISARRAIREAPRLEAWKAEMREQIMEHRARRLMDTIREIEEFWRDKER